VAFGIWAGSTEAVSCSVAGPWNPDPAVANSSTCGAGGAPNDPNTNASSITLNGTDFTEWDKDDVGVLNDTDNQFFVTGTLQSGFWYWDATNSLAEGNDAFALVLKDGGVPGTDAKWVWFILDNPSGPESTWLTNPIIGGDCATTGGAPAAGTYTHCGTWSMYGGTNGQIKNVSHVSLYGADTVEEIPGQLSAVPEPGTLLLVGAGLVGAILARRFRKVAN
jgi:hypothetical protein